MTELTEVQKTRVRQMSARRWSVTTIAERLGVPVRDVDDYVKANALTVSKATQGDNWALKASLASAKATSAKRKITLPTVRGVK